jgi:hypothetical protein
MAKIIKGEGDSKDVAELRNTNFYNKIIDFDDLERDLQAWNKAIDIEIKKKI